MVRNRRTKYVLISLGNTSIQMKGSVVLKMLLVGDSNVGKSSLLLRFVDDQFSPSFVSTVGIDFKVKDVVLPSTGDKVKLQIWDTAGQERFRTITNAYYRGAMAIIIVYDVTNKQSFSHLAYWVSQVQNQIMVDVDPLIVIVGNKADLAEHRTVGDVEGRRFAESQGCLFTETSANTGTGVSSLFIKLTELIMEKKEEKKEEEQSPEIPIIDLEAAAAAAENKKSCC